MSGCGSDDVIPEITPVLERYSNIEDYYEFSIQDGEAVQYYNSDNVYLLYDKESYNVTEYIYMLVVIFCLDWLVIRKCMI